MDATGDGTSSADSGDLSGAPADRATLGPSLSPGSILVGNKLGQYAGSAPTRDARREQDRGMPRQRKVIGSTEGGTEFGEYLGRLIERCPLTVMQLAEQIGVDRNLVYMWLRGTRVPPLHRDYVPRIARVLGLDSATERRLLEANERSAARGKRTPASRAGPRAAGELRAEAGLPLSGAARGHQAPSGIHRGTVAVVRAAIALLDSAPPPVQGGQPHIFVTYFGSRSVFDEFPELRADWNAAVQRVIAQGYTVSSLWRLDKRAERSIHLVRQVLALVGSEGDGYRVYHTRSYGTMDPPQDLLVVPGVGALLMYATEQEERTDTAFLLEDPAAVRVLEDHALHVEAVSDPVLTVYLTAMEAYAAGVRAEDWEGGRITLKNGLSTLTRPLRWFEEPAILEGRTWRVGEGFRSWVEREQQRISTFYRAAHAHSFRDICPLHAVTRLVTHGGTISAMACSKQVLL